MAQLQPTTRPECTRRCLERDLDRPKKAQHEHRLKQIRDRKQAETDPSKRKSWEQAESQELDLYQDDLENMCRTICASLRDE